MSDTNASSEIAKFLAGISGATKRKWVKAIDYRRSENWDDVRIWAWIKAESGDSQAATEVGPKAPYLRRHSPENGERIGESSIRQGAAAAEVPSQTVSRGTVEANARTIFLTGTDGHSGIVLDRAHLFRPQSQHAVSFSTSEVREKHEETELQKIPGDDDNQLPPSGEIAIQSGIRQNLSGPVVLDAFRVQNPRVLDASKPAWGFGETQGPAAPRKETLDQKRASPEVGESVSPQEVRHSSGSDAKDTGLTDLLGKGAGYVRGLGLYGFARAILYVFIIAFSRQPVESLFQALDVFGSAHLNAISALVATITMDLLAMNLFSRAVESAFGAGRQKLERCLAYGIPAILIVAANVFLTHENLNIKANVAANADAELEWKKDLAAAKDAQQKAGEGYAAAKAAFMAKKWKGALVPDDCESGKVNCKGPYIQATAAEQEAFLKAGTSLELAKGELKKLEDAKPAVSDAGSEGAVTQKLLVYLVLWASVFLSYVYQPRGRPSEAGP